MKNKFFRFTSIVLCFILFLSPLLVSADASESGIISALRGIEDIKSEFGLSNVNFEDLTYSNSVPVYDYTSDGIVNSAEFIPILYDNQIVGWVHKVYVKNEILYQFSNNFVTPANQLKNANSAIAFIYDYNTCYLYDGSCLSPLCTFEPVDGRIAIRNVDDLNSLNLSLANLNTQYNINYTPINRNARDQTTYLCNVSHVSQPSGSKLCWAASVACIANYLENDGLTAETVASAYCGSTIYNEYNQGLSAPFVLEPLNDYLDDFNEYVFYYSVPNDNQLFNNIKYGYPVYASFSGTSQSHAVVICGMNILSGFIRIMDPSAGFATLYVTSSGYYYYAAGSNTSWPLTHAICKSWSFEW